jgi:peroxiredoxin (alkyl hydroperoxide reductase subunit C)
MCDAVAVRLPLIGERAPEFEAEATTGPISFPADYEGKWVIFFSHWPTSRPCAPLNS